jgi:YgiT-type zinc finger domain-containing protein
MKCVICKHGETVDGFTSIILEKNGATIVFQQVPALVCDNCGEKYIDGKVTSSLLLKANEIIAGGVKVEIRNYQLNVA